MRTFLVFLFIVPLLFPVWYYHYFPSQDGPAHLENSKIIVRYHQPDDSLLKRYYTFNRSPENWAGHLVLAGLMNIFPPLIAEKILLTLYLLLLPISFFYILNSIQAKEKFLVIFIFSFAYNFFFHMGFYSFSLSIPLFLLALGFWIKFQDQINLGRFIILTLLFLVLYLFHIFSMIMIIATTLIMTIWQAFVDSVQQPETQETPRRFYKNFFQTRTFLLLGAMLPSLILGFVFLANRKGSIHFIPPDLSLRPIKDLLVGAFVSYQKIEIYIWLIIVFLLSIIFIHHCLYRLKSHRLLASDGILLVSLAVGMVRIFSPLAIFEGSFLKQRLNLFFWLIIVVWLGTNALKKSLKRPLILILSGSFLSLIVLHAWKYKELNQYLHEYVSSAPYFEPEKTMLPVSFSGQGQTQDGRNLSLKISPFLHASGYIAIEKNVIDLGNYEATTDHFPIKFRDRYNPYNYLGDFESKSSNIDILNYQQKTGNSVDYVLMWGFADSDLERQKEAFLLAQLAKNYELIYTSPKSMLKLYKKYEPQTLFFPPLQVR